MAAREDFLRMMAEEAAEQAVHEAVAQELTAAADEGQSAKSAAKRGLKAIFGAAGPVMALARSMPGWTFPLMGVALAAMLKKSGFIDKLLPDDDRPVIREAKFLLKNVGPHAVVGAFSGYRDAAAQIDKKVDEAASDSSTPPDKAKKWLDWLVRSRQIPGRVFVLALPDADGNIRYGDDGVPFVSDSTWMAFKDAWDASHPPTTKQVGGGKGKPSRTEVVPAEKFPFELIPMSDGVKVLGGDSAMSRTDVEALTGLLRPRSRGDRMSQALKDVLFALSATRARRDPTDQLVAESLFEDVVKNGDLALMEHTAERLAPQIQADGTLPDADYEVAVSHFDSFLGGELNLQERALRFGSRLWRGRGRMNPTLRGILTGIGWGAGIMVGFQVILFFLMVYLVGSGYATQIPNWGAALQVGLGSLVLIVMYMQLPLIQAILKFFSRLLGASDDWLVDIGRRLTFVMMPVMVVAIGLVPEIGVSFFTRFFILMLVGIQIARSMGFKLAQQFARADLLTLKGAEHGWLITGFIIAVDWAVRQAWHTAIGEFIDKLAKKWEPYVDNQYFATAAILIGAYAIGMLVVRRIFQVRGEGLTSRYKLQQRHPVGTLVVIAIAVFLAVTLPWFVKTHHEIDPFATKPAAAATMAPEHTPVAPAATTSKPTASTAGHTHTHSDALNCSALSDEGKVAAGCP